MPLRVVALWYSFTTRITQIQEEHGVPPNKHYEIPFERGYAVLFPFIIFSYERHRLHSGTSDDLVSFLEHPIDVIDH